MNVFVSWAELSGFEYNTYVMQILPPLLSSPQNTDPLKSRKMANFNPILNISVLVMDRVP